MKINILILLFYFLTNISFASNDLYSFSSSKDAIRFKKIVSEFRCVVCQNQTLDESNTPIARDIKQKIYFLISAKVSDQTIKQYLVDRYGNTILLRPPFNLKTIMLWLFPACALISLMICWYQYQKKYSLLKYAKVDR